MNDIVEVLSESTEMATAVAAVWPLLIQLLQRLRGAGDARSPRTESAPRRPTAFLARLTGDSKRYAEEWAAEWDDLPKRPRRIRALYLFRISTRAIPIGLMAWAKKRRKA
ncbi:hypothetical protein [Streptomyces sp. NPDC101115]|uniref:hypothetical protein n=1 Tax=Streptomyces sp. NPDC101115 TaxID=3366106 RepID=UPI0038279D6A